MIKIRIFEFLDSVFFYSLYVMECFFFATVTIQGVWFHFRYLKFSHMHWLICHKKFSGLKIGLKLLFCKIPEHFSTRNHSKRIGSSFWTLIFSFLQDFSVQIFLIMLFIFWICTFTWNENHFLYKDSATHVLLMWQVVIFSLNVKF